MKQWHIWPAVLIVAAGTFAKGSAQDPPGVVLPQARSAVIPSPTVIAAPQQSAVIPPPMVVAPEQPSSVFVPPTASPGWPAYIGTELSPYQTGPYGVPYMPIPPEPPPARAGHWWQKPCGCYSDINSASCWNCKTYWIFVFGSCRQFFGEPCIKQVPAFPLPAGYDASAYIVPKRCACP